MRGFAKACTAAMFLPCMVIGFVVECAIAGYRTGREIAQELLE